MHVKNQNYHVRKYSNGKKTPYINNRQDEDVLNVETKWLVDTIPTSY